MEGRGGRGEGAGVSGPCRKPVTAPWLEARAHRAQRAYFAARTPVRLRVSKAAERELDEALEALRSGTTSPTRGTLDDLRLEAVGQRQTVQARMF